MSFRHVLVSVCAVLITAHVAQALPEDRVVHFGIHSDPENPNSPIQYHLSLSITATVQDGDDIGWEITNYKIIENATLGSDMEWQVSFPFVDTDDGLWWVTHGDPDVPLRTDFLMPSRVVDTAIAVDPGHDDLEFDIEGVTYQAPPEGPPWPVTGALDFALKLSGTPDGDPPDDSGDDEPVDSPDLPDPMPSLQ